MQSKNVNMRKLNLGVLNAESCVNKRFMQRFPGKSPLRKKKKTLGSIFSLGYFSYSQTLEKNVTTLANT